MYYSNGRWISNGSVIMNPCLKLNPRRLLYIKTLTTQTKYKAITRSDTGTPFIIHHVHAWHHIVNHVKSTVIHILDDH